MTKKKTEQKYALAMRQFRTPVEEYERLKKLPLHPVEPREPFYGRLVIPLAKLVMRAQNIEITVTGSEHIPPQGTALLAMNHTGYYDFILGSVPAHLRGKRLVRFMAKKEIFDTPLVGTFMRMMRHVPVDRSNGSAAVEEALERLKNDQLIGIFPEGTISRSFELKDFKTGAVRIAAQAGVPLIPIAIWGSQRILSKGTKRSLGREFKPVHVHVGAPISTEGSLEAVKERLKQAMQELLDAARRDYAAEYGPFEQGADWLPASMGGSAPTLEQAAEIDAKARAERQAKKKRR